VRRLLALSVAVVAASCGFEFEPPDRSVRVSQAASVYAASIFDTVSWASDSLRALDGNEVYAEKCRRCHGALGRGQAEYARQRGLQMPSLVEPDWRLADMDSLRRTIFVGHEEGMPVYGIGGISPREIDGAAYYVLFVLRPDVLGVEAR
jgi:mono/diheme cytochrome c family protein